MISKAWRALMHQRIRKREQPLPIENSSSNVFCNNCCENERLQGGKRVVHVVKMGKYLPGRISVDTASQRDVSATESDASNFRPGGNSRLFRYIARKRLYRFPNLDQGNFESAD